MSETFETFETLPVATATAGDCWNLIGIQGDRSCPELKKHLHCLNCPVYAAGGKSLFERAPPESYHKDWAERLAVREDSTDQHAVNLLVFRLGDEWWALEVPLVVEVTMPRQAHRVPHRSDDTLAGIVNIRGELYLSVRLEPLLGLESSSAGDAHLRRLLVIERAGARWAASVDEVHGVHPFGAAERLNVPSTVSQHRSSLVSEVYRWNDKQVGRLNGPQLFEGLRGRIQ